MPDVILIPYDTNSNYVDLRPICDPNMNCTSLPMQVARGTQITDANGTRQATLLFPRGTTATMTLANGSAANLTDFYVRLTEYTVGPNGVRAMAADLPPTSAYTYFVEYSVNEAEAAGATLVFFSQPIISYTENFLAFPVGSFVPSGNYDRQQGVWLRSPNGRVIRILSITNGMANLDLNGSGVAADAAALAAMGIGDEERQNLALLYASGQSLWRVQVDRFWAIN